jgi:hypothetical protein
MVEERLFKTCIQRQNVHIDWFTGFVVGSAANKAYNGALLADEHDVVVVGVK